MRIERQSSHRYGQTSVFGASPSADVSHVMAEPSVADSLPTVSPWEDDILSGQNTQVRWHAQAFPLKLCVKEDKALLSVVLQAAKDWEKASLGLISFGVEPQENEADIVLGWVDETTLGRDYEVGHTQRQVTDQGRILHATIELIRNPLIDAHLTSETQQQARLKTTVLHELGHALGLEHATSDKAVMHHRGWQNSRLTPYDEQAILALYRQGGSTTLKA